MTKLYLPDGKERSVAFALCTLTISERNYSQVIKWEALFLIFGVKHFNSYLYHQRLFTIVTDHKPLTAILGPKIPAKIKSFQCLTDGSFASEYSPATSGYWIGSSS